MNCHEIISAWLIENRYDGLVETDGECGCGLDELAPCGSPYSDCEPAYKTTCDGCGETIYSGERTNSICFHCQEGEE